MKTLIKQPSETVPLTVEFGGTTTISALEAVNVQARGLVSGALPLTVEQQLLAGALTLTISDGTADERYLISCIADDSDGNRREVEIEVYVLDLAWQMPDGGAPMLSIAEFVDRFGIDEVVRMTDARGDGRIGRDLLVNALTDAQATVEMHIGSRYALPLTDVPRFLQLCIADITRARLYPNGAPEGVASAAKAATRALERIQAAESDLPGTPGSAAPSDSPILIQTGGRAYPDGLKDFGL